jgi:hypothetical protein
VQIGAGQHPDPMAVFPAKHASVGELVIWADSREATVSIGDITHGHFGAYNPELTQDQIDEEVTNQVLDFLEYMFADKYLIWKSDADGSGGWQHFDYMDRPLERRMDAEYFVWSGPF